MLSVMKRNFEILISFRTPQGFRACGQYFLGKDRAFAEQVFNGLTGRQDIDDNAVIHLDLLELTDCLPEKVKTISCRLNELGENCRYITRELFRSDAIEPH